MSSLLTRLRRMDMEEARFRAVSGLRNLSGRARHLLSPPRWRRADLPAILAAPASVEGAALSRAREGARAGDWIAAHHALAQHFASRHSAFPLDALEIPPRVDAIRSRFPGSVVAALERANRVLDGRYDLLGYSGVEFGRPPDWHADPVHHRRAPLAFWAAVPYLHPACGDHKIIWELNRHQHWLALGRAFALTGDRRYYREFVAQLEDWIVRNPPLVGINWASMLELAFRSLSWLWALSFFSTAAQDDPDDAPPWLVDLLVAIDRQLAHIDRNLSRYFSPNTHLTGEALALYVAGQCLPELSSSTHRSRVGRHVLVTEVGRQVLADGGHAELSAHYHRYSTDFYLLALAVARRSGDAAAARFEDAARRQAAFLRTLADRLGRLPQLGDDDGGQLFPICGRAPVDCSDTLAIAASQLDDASLMVGSPPEEAFWLLGTSAAKFEGVRPAPWRSRALASTGYYVSRNADGDHLVFDAGPQGYLNGGHAHSDALAIVLTTRDRPLLIDPGTATYTMEPELRDLFRSTAMHNTVVVNQRPQARPRGPFHWERTADARATAWQSADRCDYMEGRHEAYAPFVHTRTIVSLHGVGWLILDVIDGAGAIETEAHWHVAPGWIPKRAKERTVELSYDGCTAALTSTGAIHILDERERARLNCVSAAYGRVDRSTTLTTTAAGRAPALLGTFVSSAPELVRSLAIEPVELATSPGEMWLGSAYEVTWQAGTLVALAAVPAGPDADGSGPGRLWGTRGVQTDGRAAVVVSRDGIPCDLVLVNGRSVIHGDGERLVELEATSDIARLTLTPELASSVQSARTAER